MCVCVLCVCVSCVCVCVSCVSCVCVLCVSCVCLVCVLLPLRCAFVVAVYTRAGLLCDSQVFYMLARCHDATEPKGKSPTAIFYFGFSRESELMEWFRLLGAVMNMPTIKPYFVKDKHVSKEKRLGSGAFGAVYSGRLKKTKPVAIKIQQACGLHQKFPCCLLLVGCGDKATNAHIDYTPTPPTYGRLGGQRFTRGQARAET